MNLKFIYVGSIANKTTSIVNVSLINMLDMTISVNFTFNDQSDAQSNIVDYTRWDTNFTITPGTNYNLTLTYDSTVENITIKTKGNKDVYTGFIYLLLESEDATHSGKYQKTFNLE